MALLLLASCGSTSDIFGGGNNDTYNQTLHGTVDTVDLNSNSIVLMNTSGYNTNLSGGNRGSSGNSVRVYFDNNTTVNYNGQSYRPENLDRGDQVDVNVRQSGNQLIADTMTVTYNTNPNGSNSTNSGVYASGNYTGTVRYVDTTRRTIQLDRGTGSYVTVDYDPNTTVLFNGRSYLPADLEVGDQVTIYTRDIGGGRTVASNIDVTRSMTSGSTSSSYATLRGTVRSINTSNRTIDLEQTSYISGFLPNGSSRSSVITVQYDTNARVNVSGSMQPLSGLERGDVIEIQAQDLGNSNWMASSISLIRDVRR
jgi:hypothetical protein